MLRATPTNWLSWNYDVSGDSGPLSTLMYKAVREAGWFDLDGRHFEIHREPNWGDFVLSGPDGEIARATKTHIMTRHFTVRLGGMDYDLDGASTFSRGFVLRGNAAQGGFEVGSIRPQRFLSRTAVAEFADTLTNVEQHFLLWLVLLIWRRQSSS
jgi:hypothetical protein